MKHYYIRLISILLISFGISSVIAHVLVHLQGVVSIRYLAAYPHLASDPSFALWIFFSIATIIWILYPVFTGVAFLFVAPRMGVPILRKWWALFNFTMYIAVSQFLAKHLLFPIAPKHRIDFFTKWDLYWILLSAVFFCLVTITVIKVQALVFKG